MLNLLASLLTSLKKSVEGVASKSVWSFNLVCLLLLVSLSLSAQQPIQVLWPLTSDGEAVYSAGIGSAVFTPGPGVQAFSYDTLNGATSTGWNSRNLNPNVYYEYIITPERDATIVINELNFEVSLSLVNMRTAVRYSKDGFAQQSVPVTSNVYVARKSSRNLQVLTKITVSYPETLSIRIYGWSAPTPAVSFFTRNVEFSGIIRGPMLLDASASVTSPILCFGGIGTVTITATGFTGTPSYTFDGNTNNSGIFIGITAGTGYTWSVTDGPETFIGPPLDVTQPTILNASAIQSAILCNGGTTSVNIAATGGTAPYTGTGVFSQGAGSQTYTITDANGCTDDVTVVLNQPNLLTVTASSNSPTNAPLCQGATLNLTSNPVGGTAPYTYSWTGPNGFTSILGDPSITNVLPVASGTYSVTVTDANICPPVQANTEVLINPTVVPSVIITANPGNSICEGTSVLFTAFPTNGGSSPTYQWFLNNVFTGQTGPTYTNSTLAQGNRVKVVMTSSLPCPTTPTATSNIITMTVNPILVPTVTIEASATSFCSGTNVTFSVDVLTNGGTNPTYQWYLNGAPVGTAATYSNNTLVTGNAIYLVVTSNATCASPNTATSNTITVNVIPDMTVTLGAGSNANPTICINTALTPIVYNTTGASGATVTGLPTGVTFTWAANNVTITGTPSVAGTFNYTVTPIGGCGNNTATGTITVTANNTINLTSAVGTNSQTVCINSPITQITYSTTGATGASFSVFPTGVTGSFNSNTVTISGTPTVSGSFPYTITLTGGCGNITTSGTINVTPNNTITLTSAAGTNNQTVCINTAITPITYSTTGATGATFTVFPSGVSGVFNTSTNTVTITGTPSFQGSYPYTVTLTGGCGTITASGTINVTPNNTITLSSAAGTNTQTVCINTAITPITYTTTGATGANFSGLPTGVTGSWAASVVTITGTPTVSGSFPYEVKLSGGCGVISATGQITVSPNATITLTSAPATTAQEVCRLSAITNITYAIVGATTYNVSGLPPGVNATFAGGIITISGTPNNTINVTTTYTYTITTTGGCVNTSVSGTIKVYVGNPSVFTGNITGVPRSICPPGTLNISVTAVNNVQYYDWILPVGFDIIAGAGTNNITVSVTEFAIVGNNQVISVQAVNPCGRNNRIQETINVGKYNGVTVTPDAQSVCSGGSIIVTGVLTGASASGTWTASPVGSGTFSNISTNYPNVTATFTPSILSGIIILTITTNAPTGSGCSNVAATATVTLSVFQAVTITQQPSPATQTVCSGSNVTFSVTATGSGLSYQWRKNGVNITGATSSTLTLTNVTSTSAGTYSVVVSGTAPCASVTSSNAVLNVNGAIVITAQPVSQIVCTGSSVTFSVIATGNISSYQWRKNGANITGATTSNLTINPVNLSDAGSYDVIAYGVSPCSNATSTIATLTVNEAVSITSQPTVTPSPACTSSTVVFSVTATGTGLTYQWRKNGTPIPGATSSTYTIISADLSDAGTYNVIVTGATSCPPVTSSNVVLVVNEEIVIKEQPIDQDVCTGGTAKFSVEAIGSIAGYQWRKGTTNLIDGGNISGVNTATLTLTNVALSDAGLYNVIVYGTTPCPNAISDDARLTVTEGVVITTQPASQTACTGNTILFNVTTTGDVSNYQWRKGSTNLNNGGNVSGVNTATLTLTNVGVADAGSYNVVITGAGPCGNVTSNNAVLTVNKAVTITTQPVNVSVCVTYESQLSVVATGDGLTYQWYKDGIPVPGATSPILLFTSTQLSNAGNYYVVVSGAAPCAPVTSNTVTLNVDQTIIITTQPQSQQKCVGETVVFTVVANVSRDLTFGYFWYKDGIQLVNGGNISGQGTSILTVSNITAADAGTYKVEIKGDENYMCPKVWSQNAILTVLQNANIVVPANATQAVCEGVLIQPIVFTFTGSVTTATVTGLPAGITGNYVGGILTISGSSTVIGAFTYTVTATGLCLSDSETGTITVNPNNTIALDISSGPINQTICITESIEDIIYNTTGATGATVSGLPAGVLGAWDDDKVVITGTPTQVGTFNYTVALTGGCGVVSTGGTITVNPVNSFTLTSGQKDQTKCINTAIETTTWTTIGATGITVAGLPTGVNATWAPNVITMSGTPSVSGTFNYTISLTGGCGIAEIKGIITVTPDNIITLTSGNSVQTVCINTPIVNITYSTSGASGATFANLPPGVIGALAANVVTISGTPTSTVSSPYNYTVTLTGGCGIVTATGTITVTPLNVVTLTSATGTNDQTVCINTPITTITYSTTGATSGTVSGLPAGVNGVWASNVVTISGTPTVFGVFTYTINLIGGCPITPVTGTIRVNDIGIIALTSPAGSNIQTVCYGTPIANITYAISGGATGATVSGLPTGVAGNYAAGVFTISGAPTPSPAGIFNYTVTTTGPCANNSLSGTITVDPTSIGGIINPPISAVCDNNASLTLTLSGHTGSIIRWEYSIDGGLSWVSINSQANPLILTNIIESALYHAVVQSGECPEVASARAVVSLMYLIDPVAIANPSPICLGQTTTLTATGIPPNWGNFGGGTYGNANPEGWRITENGVEINFPANANNTDVGPWSETNPKTFNGIYYDSGDPKFSIVNGALNSTMETPVFSLAGLIQADLTWEQAFNLLPGSWGKIELSIDGGVSYNIVLAEYIGPATMTPYVGFNPQSIGLTNYLGLTSLRIRFNYHGVAMSSWGVDNVMIDTNPGATVTFAYHWSSIDNDLIPLNGIGQTISALPTYPGTHTYKVDVYMTVGNVTCWIGSSTVDVTVYDNPVCSITGPTEPICPLSLNTYSAPANMTYLWTITGNGTISGSSTAQNVNVRAGSNCDQSYTLTLRITDLNGCQSTCSVTHLVDDNTFPTASNPDPLTVQCIGNVPAPNINVVDDEADNCGIPVVTHISDVSDGNTCPQVITRTYRVTDLCGNYIDVTQAITVDDTENPVLTCPGSLTAVCTISEQPVYANYAAFTAAGGIATDNCGIDPASFRLVSETEDGLTCPKTYTRTYEIKDLCGNIATCQQTIVVDDNINPTASNPAAINVECFGEVPAPDITVVTNEADNCGIPVVAFVSDVSNNQTCPEIITRTYSVTDACFNQILVTQIITVDDDTDPLITGTIPQSDLLGCDVTIIPDAATTVALLEALGVAVSDNCTLDAELVVTHTDNAAGTCPIRVTRVYTVKDKCNNTTSVTQIITVDDDTAPIVTPPAGDLVLECFDAAAVAAWAAGASATDNCTPGITVTFNYTAPTDNCNESIIVTFTAIDNCLNTGTATKTIAVNDDTDPLITGTLPIVNHEGCTVADIPAAVTTIAALEALGLTISDNCTPDANLVVTSSVGTPNGTCPIVVVRTYTIDDACGNTSIVNQTFNIDDNTPPTITCPDPNSITVSTDAGETFASDVPVPTPGYSDNCGTAVLTWTSSDATQGSGTGPFPINNTFQIGTTTITWIVTDGCLNTNTCTFTVIVLQNTPPEITCANVTVNNDPGLCSASINPPEPIIIAGDLPITFSWTMSGATTGSGTGPINNFTFNVGITNILWTATNSAGSATCTSIITVIDNQLPTFTLSAPPSFCVNNIFSANYDGQLGAQADIVPDPLFQPPYPSSWRRPDWYVLNGTTELDILNILENCCLNANALTWTIAFSGTDVNQPDITGIGQPSAHGPIILWGSPINIDVTHTITYRLTDCIGNYTEQTMNIVIKPRPDIIKQP